MSDDETYDLIFHPGLSTVDEVTDVSGRGVGMDVVKRTVEDLDGTVSIDSEKDEGTTVTMRLPVTVAIDEILFVESGGEEFGVPTKAVQDIEPAGAIEMANGESVLPGDGSDYPVISLADVLETPTPVRTATGWSSDPWRGPRCRVALRPRPRPTGGRRRQALRGLHERHAGNKRCNGSGTGRGSQHP